MEKEWKPRSWWSPVRNAGLGLRYCRMSSSIPSKNKSPKDSFWLSRAWQESQQSQAHPCLHGFYWQLFSIAGCIICHWKLVLSLPTLQVSSKTYVSTIAIGLFIGIKYWRVACLCASQKENLQTSLWWSSRGQRNSIYSYWKIISQLL